MTWILTGACVTGPWPSSEGANERFVGTIPALSGRGLKSRRRVLSRQSSDDLFDGLNSVGKITQSSLVLPFGMPYCRRFAGISQEYHGRWHWRRAQLRSGHGDFLHRHSERR